MASPPPPPSTPLAPGFRFYPTDEELVGYYLRRKVAGLPLRVDAIAEVELYRWAPWELPRLSRLWGRDCQWFFFSPLDRKYDCSLRANRATADGFWKSTGKDRSVLLDERKVIGMKKSLVFHVGRAPNGRRTDWVMHEYRLEEDEKSYIGTRGTSFVVCRLFQKSKIGQKKASYGAPLIVEEWEEEEVVPTGEAVSDVLTIAAVQEPDNIHSNDFEQGMTETMRIIDQLTIGFETSSSDLNPPSKGLLAPGFRFHPTDEELISYYLKRKVTGLPLRVDAIAEVNLYNWAPWDLPSLSRLSLNMLNTEWYFFSALDRKYANNRFSNHNNRATTEGYWKSTGNDRPVHSRTSAKIIGMKKTLVFHAGRSPFGQRTNWVMHEYRLEEDEQNSKGCLFVVCRIFQKCGAGPRKPRALYGAPFIEEWEEVSQDLVATKKDLAAPDITDADPNVAIDVVQEQNHAHASNGFEQGTRGKIYSIGSKVEIAYIREKLPVAWYMATVIKVVDERILLVEYENLRAEDDTLLSEIVSTQYIRPDPPVLEVRNFDLLDEVEAFYNGGWWPGVIAKVNAGSRYNVKFMHWEEEIEFDHTELRLLYDWVDGRWIQASQDKSIESQNLGGYTSVGHLQLLPASKTASKCQVPGSVTPLSGCGDEAPSEFLICTTNYGSENSGRLTSQSQQEGLQPCKKVKKGEMIGDNAQLSDSGGSETSSAVKTGFDVRTPIIEEESHFRIKALVEKCCSTSPFKKINVASEDSITKPSSNISLREINEDPQIRHKSTQELVLFQKPLSSKEEEHSNSKSGKSKFLQMADTPQGKELVPELDHQGDKGAQQHKGENRRKNCRPQKLRIIEPLLEGDSVGNKQGNKALEPPIEGLSAAQCVTCSDNGSEAQGLFNVIASSSDASLVETSTSSVQPSEAGSEAQNKVLLSTIGEQLEERGVIDKAGDLPPKQSPLPFEKCSFMWDSIGSMEIFNVMPQRPHFRPLEQYCRDFREGMAIGLMVTFSNVVNSIRKLKITDPRHKFDGLLKTLMQLEGHGFYVQGIRARLVELLRMKDDQDHLVDEKYALKTLLEKVKREKRLLNVESETIQKASREFEQFLSHFYEEKGYISKRKRENDSKLDRIEMDSWRVENALLSAEREFEAIRAATW